MAQQPTRAIPRPKQPRFKVAVDENSIGPTATRPKLVNMTGNKVNLDKSKAVLPPATRYAAANRAALGEIHNVRKKEPLLKNKENAVPSKAPVAKDNVPGGVKRRRSPSLHAATARPARIPHPPVSNVNKATNPPAKPVSKVTVDGRKNALSVSEPEPPRRLGRMLQAINTRRQSQVILSSSCDSRKSSERVAFPSERPSSVVLSSRAASPVATSEAALQDEEDEDDTIHPPAKPIVETKEEPAPSRPSPESEATQTPKSEARRPEELFEQMTDGDWLYAPPEKRMEYRKEVERVASTFKEEPDLDDPTMVAEYADEIFEYMAKLEEESMPRPDYMAGQQEITWEMRATLVDWLLQVHLRYQMLPETLWIAVNIIDRFLSKRIVSVVKLQLVGVTAMFIAAKYEEIIAPGVDEYVKMTESGYKRDEILKGEKIVLQTIDFRISSYCSPYSWVRRISKADNYNLQTRTLCKFLMELTLLDYRFLRAKPSLIAAIGMYSARRMLGQDWNDAFIYYSGHVEEELRMGHDFIVEALAQPEFESQYIYKKYTSRKFLKASLYACNWAQEHYQSPRK